MSIFKTNLIGLKVAEKCPTFCWIFGKIFPKGKKSSKFYQIWLQIVGRGASLFIFLSGVFFELERDKLMISFLFLLFNLLTGFAGSHFKYSRIKAIVHEAETEDNPPKLRPSKYYQKWLQISGRGKDAFAFGIGLLLGKGFFFTSLILLTIQLTTGYIMSELVYLREQAVIREKT